MPSKRGIRDGDRVRVYNDLGACELQAMLSPTLKPGQVVVYHAWEPFQFTHGNSDQVLIPSPLNPIQLAGGYFHLQPMVHDAAAWMQRSRNAGGSGASPCVTRGARSGRVPVFAGAAGYAAPRCGAVGRSSMRTYDVTIIGGCGHVGLPLGIALADTGLRVALYDLNQAAVDTVNAASLPHDEPGAAAVLERVLADERLTATSDRTVVARSRIVIVVVGTPIDEHLNPDVEAVPRAIAAIADQLRDGQLLVLRSTVYPGVTAMVEKVVERRGGGIDVAFCPERIAEGKAMTELHELPQIVAVAHRHGPRAGVEAVPQPHRTTSSSSSPRRPSSPSCSPTPGATSSSRPPTSSS